MSVKWKICDECGKKVNESAKTCPYCNSKSFSDIIDVKANDSTKDKTKSEKNNTKNEDGADKEFESYYNDSKNKFKQDFDNFSNSAKKAGNDFLYKNLPDEYADKLKNDFNNFSQFAVEVADNTSNDLWQMGEGFINENISKESQEKIKMHGENLSNSTKKFVGEAATTLFNIHQRRQKIRNEKKELKRKEKEEKQRKKEKERQEREKRRAAERKMRQQKEEERNQRGVSHFKKGVEYYKNNEIRKCHEEFEASFKLLKRTSKYYSQAKLYYSATFLSMTNATLVENPAIVFTVLDMAVKHTPDAIESFEKYDSGCKNALKELKMELFLPTEVNYFNIDFSTEFGQRLAGGWILIVNECEKIDSDYKYEKLKGDLFGRTGHHDLAVLCFEEALKSSSCDFRVWGYMAQSLKALGRYSEANDCFSRLSLKLDEELRKDPNNVYLLREKAITFASMGLKDRALMIYDQILDIDPSADFVQEDIRRLKFL